MPSRRDNVLSCAVQHPPLVGGGAVGFGQFVQGQQASLFNDGPARAVVEFAVVPGNAVTLSAWWFGQDNRSTTVVFETYDGPVTLNPDGSVTIPGGTTPLATVTLDQTRTPDVAAGLASVPFVTGTAGSNPDPNATAADGSSVPYATIYGGTPTGNILSMVTYKTDGGNPGTYNILDSYLIQSASALLPPLKTARVVGAAVGTAGRLVALYLGDLGGNPSVLTAVDGSKTPVVKVNGTPVATSTPVWGNGPGQPQLTHAVLRMTDPVGPTAVVTVDVEDSWCTTHAGACGVAAGIVATNLVGGSILPAFVAGRKRMLVGMNLSNPKDIYVPVFRNLVRGLRDWAGNVADDFTTDAGGSIASMGSNTNLSCQVVGGFNNPGDASQTYLQSIPGVYTLGYATGAPVYTLDGNGAPTTILSGPTDDGAGTTTILYLFGQSAPHFGPEIDLHCTAPGELKFIYPPDPAAPTERSVDGSGEWYSQFLDQIDGFQVGRFMDWLGTNDSNVSQFSDFSTDSTLSFSRTNNRVSVASVVRIEPYTDTTNRYAGGLYGVLILMTTSAPHGIAPGPIQNGTLGGFHGPGEVGPSYPGLFPTVTPTDTVQLNGQFSLLDAISPTTFIVRIHATGTTTAVLDAAYTSADFGGGATVAVHNRIGGSPASAYRLCAATGIDPWVNAPTGIRDDGLWDPADPTNSLFGLACTILPPTATLWVEFGNEIWNFNFLQFTTATIQGNIAGQTLAEWVTHRTAAVHALAEQAAAALGWGGTIRRVYSGFATDLSTALASGYPVNAVAINNYWTNQPISEDFAATYAGYTHADRMDLYDFYIANSDMARNVKSWSDAIRAVYPDASVVVYEGAAASGLLFAADSGAESRRWARDPEQYHDVLANMQVLQDNDCALFNWFTFSGPLQDNGTTSFSAFFNCDQTDGDGTPGQNAAFDDFTTNPKSQVGGALRRWASLVNPGGGVAPVPRPRVFRSPAFRSRALSGISRR